MPSLNSKAGWTVLAAVIIFNCPFSGFSQESSGRDVGPKGVDSAVSSGSSEEIVFNGIELAPEGVIGRDTAGNRWTYDFNRNRFRPASESRAADRSGRIREVSVESARPVEVRCTERLVVERPSLKAVYIGDDEYVDGDIVAYGRVTVKGWVQGDIQSFNKRVLVTSTGRVDGDIRAPKIEIKEGGEVWGRQLITDPLTIPVDMIRSQFATEGIWVVFGFTIALSLIAFLASSLAPRRLGNIISCVEQHQALTVGLGLLMTFLLPLITVLVAITIVGIALLPLIPVAYFVAFALGMCAFGKLVGRPLMIKWLDRDQGLVGQSLAGVWIFMGLWALVAILLGSGSGGATEGFGIALLVVAIVATTYPLLAGIGASLLTRFGFRVYQGRGMPDGAPEPQAPAPPPLPKAPEPDYPAPPLPPRRPPEADDNEPPLSAI